MELGRCPKPRGGSSPDDTTSSDWFTFLGVREPQKRASAYFREGPIYSRKDPPISNSSLPKDTFQLHRMSPYPSLFELAATLSSLQRRPARLLLVFSTSALPLYASRYCHFMIQGTGGGR